MKILKIKIVLLFIFLGITYFVKAQSIDNPAKIQSINISHNSQRMFENALGKVVFCLRQEYVIQNKKGEQFGHLGNEYFGKKYSIGVWIGSDIWFPAYLRKPWQNDKNFKEFENTHLPLCSDLYIKNINGGVERQLSNLDIDTTQIITFLKQGRGGLSFSEAEDISIGYLMLYHIPEEPTKKFPEITVTLHQLDQVIWNNKGKAEVKNYNYLGKKSIGGVYLVEDITTGTIELKVSGLYIKEGSNWILRALPPPNKS